MFNTFKLILRTPSINATALPKRTFLSQAYYCNEVWEHRLRNPILSKINLNELYQDLHQRYNKTGEISAVDVDIFTNAAKEESFVEEVVDLVHKLRMSAAASNIFESTSHAVVRLFVEYKKHEELLRLLNDRLNYGIFLDYYTLNLLMDTFYKNKDFISGARCASHLMLQEEMENPLSVSLALLHCYKYISDPKDWPQEPLPEEPDEEVKIRVKYVRNPYFDDHFDLTDCKQIIGKTLSMLTKSNDNILHNSLHILGLVLCGKTEDANIYLQKHTGNNQKLYAEILDILPEDNAIRKTMTNHVESGNIEELLTNNVKEMERRVAEKDISEQCEKYMKWEQKRKEALEEQHRMLLVQKKLANIEDVRKQLKERETKLWFFENEDKIELGIQAKKVFYPKKWFGKKKKPKKVDEGYIPPEVK